MPKRKGAATAKPSTPKKTKDAPEKDVVGMTGLSFVMPPLNLQKWIDEHQDLLQPPVTAKMIYEESMYVVMIVGGPNRRTDYHVNQTEEFFYQLKGDMVLKIHDILGSGEFRDVHIKEGEIFLLPANVPHSPQRFSNTTGLVIEMKRREGMIDKLRWYCSKCHNVIYEEQFHVQTLDLGVELKPIIERFYASEKLRTCKCGEISQPPELNA